jgi:hypothetical protein
LALVGGPRTELGRPAKTTYPKQQPKTTTTANQHRSGKFSLLSVIAGTSVLAHRKVVQARALLLAADGVANQEIARRFGVDSDAVRRWRVRFADNGLA